MELELALLPQVVVDAVHRLQLFTAEIASWEDATLPRDIDGREPGSGSARAARAELARRVRERSKVILTQALVAVDVHTPRPARSS